MQTQKGCKNRDRVDIKVFPEFPGLTVMRAVYVTQRFSRHSHDGFAFGVVERGALKFSYRGEQLVASPGRINLVNPDEPHDGCAGTEDGWTYRMFYCDPDILQRAAKERCGASTPLPFFQKGVLDDADLAAEIHALHVALSDGSMGRLEGETRFLQLCIAFIGRHADTSASEFKTGREHLAVSTVKQLLEEKYGETIALAELARHSGLSPFHLIRVFKEETGLTPHRYLTQIRVRRAEQLLRRGHDLADTASEVGFADQSHLNRHFKSIIGVPPGSYRNFVQDARS